MESRRRFSRRAFLAGSAGAIVAGCTRPKPEATAAAEGPNVVVFLSDTLRADALPCYGYARPTAPRISEFAKGAILFEDAHSAAPWTLPSTATLLTGVHPYVHRTVVTEWSDEGRARDRAYQVLPNALKTTASHLTDRGYDCGCFQSNKNVTAERGLARGFGEYVYQFDASPGDQIDTVLNWLKTKARRPFYAYIHLIDPHQPYRPFDANFLALFGESIEASVAKAPAEERARLAEYHTYTWDEFYLKGTPGKRITPDELEVFSEAGREHYRRLYDSEVLGIDQVFGKFMDYLTSEGLDDNTVVAITSDHGEAFGEDGEWYHGSKLDDPQTHVPLILKLPGATEGRRVASTVGLIDLHPTLMGIVGATHEPVATGAPLADRAGKILITEDHPILMTLDEFHEDIMVWGSGLVQGDLIVWAVPESEDLEVRTRSTGDTKRLTPSEVDALEPGAVKRVIETYRKVRLAAIELSATVADPEWVHYERGNLEELESIGYLN